jgi:hypothetical protein
LRYRDAEGEETEREIEARLLFLRDGRPEMLAAWCRLREDLRHFRIDRMAALRPEGEDGWIEGPEAVAAFLAARWTAIPAVAWKRWRGGPGAGAWTALVALARADQRLSMAERQMLGRILAGLSGVPGAEAQIDADLRLARFSAAEARAAAAAVAADPMAPRIREAARQVRALARSPHPEQDALLSTILGDAPEP